MLTRSGDGVGTGQCLNRGRRHDEAVSTYSATTALPYRHLERASAALRELRHQLLAAGVHELPDWDTLDVAGPTETNDGRGRTRAEHRGTDVPEAATRARLR